MNDIPAEDEQEIHPERTPHSIPVGMVKVASYGNPSDADLDAAVLEAQGIRTEVFGANAGMLTWYWQLFIDVDLCVREEDAQAARNILAQIPTGDLVPAEEPAGAPPPVDEQGRPLVSAADFGTASELRDAQTVLASAGIQAFGPKLVKRADRPAGAEERFVLRVPEEDLQEAQRLILENAEESSDDPRCPRCGSWRIKPVSTFINGIAGAFGLGHDASENECQACHYKAAAAEFLAQPAQ